MSVLVYVSGGRWGEEVCVCVCVCVGSHVCMRACMHAHA